MAEEETPREIVLEGMEELLSENPGILEDTAQTAPRKRKIDQGYSETIVREAVEGRNWPARYEGTPINNQLFERTFRRVMARYGKNVVLQEMYDPQLIDPDNKGESSIQIYYADRRIASGERQGQIVHYPVSIKFTHKKSREGLTELVKSIRPKPKQK